VVGLLFTWCTSLRVDVGDLDVAGAVGVDVTETRSADAVTSLLCCLVSFTATGGSSSGGSTCTNVSGDQRTCLEVRRRSDLSGSSTS
jgi:hypothetical protein